MDEATRGILFVEALTTAVVTLEVTPDGGVTWYDSYSAEGTKHEFTITTPLTRAFVIDGIAGDFRISVGTANMTDCYFEGLREIG